MALHLAPPMFPSTVSPEKSTLPSESGVLPFGLSRAVPVAPGAEVVPALTLCAERQISVTGSGEPFIHAPSMATQLVTTSQTREDSQLATDNENDTD
ncbi:putative ATP-grasp-modified RiPP [Streptomyces noursei]|uniref:putative ATP-grasp-modified RiPP n=1 Tax=Streptomyces noursei TaxID=1971 RepID=UPI00344FCBBA